MQQTFRFRDLLLKTVGVWQNRDPISQLESQSLAMELVLLIIKDHTNLQESKYSSSASLNWIHSYLSFHLSEPLSVGDMARQARMSTSHFSDMFLKQFGVTPYKYLYRLRIQHAQELLEKTELPQDQIAEYCGFSDIHHFSKAFKKETGQTPGHYRKS
jgi:transcriptional regulator GlxA family with amidase domain